MQQWSTKFVNITKLCIKQPCISDKRFPIQLAKIFKPTSPGYYYSVKNIETGACFANMDDCSFGKYHARYCGRSKSSRIKRKSDRRTWYPLPMLDGNYENSIHNPDKLTESQLILYRTGFFESNDETRKHDFSTFTVCPQHRKELGISYRYDSPFCSLQKGEEAYHKETNTIISRKYVDLEIAEAVYKDYKCVVPIGAGKDFAHFWHTSCILLLHTCSYYN